LEASCWSRAGTSSDHARSRAEHGSIVRSAAFAVNGSILRSFAPRNFGRNQPGELPAIRIGVDGKHKGWGLGAALLRHFMFKAIEVAGTVGVRLVLAHAKDEEAKSFYRYYGFFESPIDPLDHDGAHR